MTSFVSWNFPKYMPTSIDDGRSVGYTISTVNPCVTQSYHEVPSLILRAWQAAISGATVLGWVSYEAAPAFDSAFLVRTSADFPLAIFWIIPPQACVAEPVDHERATAGDFSFSQSWFDATAPTQFASSMADVRNAIASGRYYQLNYTTQLKAFAHGNPYVLYQNLVREQGAGYCAYLETDRWAVMSLSPELFFDWDGSTIVTQPMKGTARIGKNPTADAAKLRASEKDRAENVMIVDLLRNDLSRIAKPGTVSVSSMFDVQQLSTVLQMTSTVQANTREGTTLADIFAALFPCGSITGAPKVEAMKHIAEIEPHGRGVYCGAIGLIRPGGHATFNVAIRTAVMDKHTHALSYGVGSGITWYSDVAAELDEWRTKAHFLYRASNAFHLFETLRLEDGAFARLDLHMARLAHAASYFGYVFDSAAAERKLCETSAVHRKGLFRVKLCLYGNGELSIAVQAHSDPAQSVCVQLGRESICSPSEYLRFKTSRRAHYDAFAPVRGDVFDTLLYQPSGELTEFTRGNLVVEQDGVLLTPKENGQFLPGVMRNELLKSRVVSEGTIRVETLSQASRVWFINSLRGWLPVSHVINADGSVLFCSTSN